MGYTTDFLMTLRCVIKFHEGMMKHVCSQYNLSLIEANIIAFLHNNPGKDTAKDIVELRMLSKGNVSQAVESLIQKSLLQRAGECQGQAEGTFNSSPQSLLLLPKLLNPCKGIFIRSYFREFPWIRHWPSAGSPISLWRITVPKLWQDCPYPPVLE